jgi:extracellular factor (EF) 3-hydroxypalmitic acid methyl ester biosynthesis protein
MASMGTEMRRSRADAEHVLLVLFDRAQHDLSAGAAAATVLSELARGLCELRAALPSNVWKPAVHAVVPGHALTATLSTGPLARRSRSKPRGNRPDAILRDMIYGVPELPESADPSGAVAAFERDLPSIASSRDACARMRLHITRLAPALPDARILALACGHLRELDATVLAHFAKSARIVAVDPDPDAVASVRRRLIDPRVRAVCADPATLAERSRRAGRQFDLVYCIAPDAACAPSFAGLFTSAPALLRPGGTLLIAALAEHRADAGYLEACLDWWPHEYTRDDVSALLGPILGWGERTVTLDRRGALFFVKLVRDADACAAHDRTLRGR